MVGGLMRIYVCRLNMIMLRVSFFLWGASSSYAIKVTNTSRVFVYYASNERIKSTKIY